MATKLTQTGAQVQDLLDDVEFFNASSYGVSTNLADNASALEAALAASALQNKPIGIAAGTYNVLGRVDVPSGARLIGLGKPGSVVIKYNNTSSSDAFRLTSVSKVVIENITIDGNFSDGGFANGNCLDINNSSEVFIKNCVFTNAADELVSVNNSSSNISFTSCNFSDCATQEGLAIYNSSFVTVDKSTFSNNTGFGIFGAHADNLFITNNVMIDNGLEGVGLRYSCNKGFITNNYITGSNDNGISVSGTGFSVIGNYVENNNFHGICVFGDYNTVQGNSCFNNGKSLSGSTTFQSGIAIRPGFGGGGSYNIINGNICGDNQAVKTQEYGVSVSSHLYTAWADAQTITVSTSTAVYRTNDNKYYEALNSGTTATGSEPTHTTGDATGADGITWRYIATNASSITGNFEGHHNRIFGNVDAGNKTSDAVMISNAQQNFLQYDGYIQIEVPDGTAATSNFTRIISTNGSPAGVITGTPGDLVLRRGGSIGNRSAYVFSDGWNPLMAQRAGTTAARPANLVSGDAGLIFLDTTIGKPIWWSGSGWVDATGASV